MAGKIFTVFLVFPVVPKASEADTWLGQQALIPIILICWSVTEPLRYAFYTFKGAQNGLLGDLRYNMFWVIYPLGTTLELCCFYLGVRNVLAIEPESERPFTILMPNKLNFELKYQWMVYFMFVAFALGFPTLYIHLVKQRKNFYQRRQEMVGKTDPENDDAYGRVN